MQHLKSVIFCSITILYNLHSADASTVPSNGKKVSFRPEINGETPESVEMYNQGYSKGESGMAQLLGNEETASSAGNSYEDIHKSPRTRTRTETTQADTVTETENRNGSKQEQYGEMEFPIQIQNSPMLHSSSWAGMCQIELTDDDVNATEKQRSKIIREIQNNMRAKTALDINRSFVRTPFPFDFITRDVDTPLMFCLLAAERDSSFCRENTIPQLYKFVESSLYRSGAKYNLVALLGKNYVEVIQKGEDSPSSTDAAQPVHRFACLNHKHFQRTLYTNPEVLASMAKLTDSNSPLQHQWSMSRDYEPQYKVGQLRHTVLTLRNIDISAFRLLVKLNFNRRAIKRSFPNLKLRQRLNLYLTVENDTLKSLQARASRQKSLAICYPIPKGLKPYSVVAAKLRKTSTEHMAAQEAFVIAITEPRMDSFLLPYGKHEILIDPLLKLERFYYSSNPVTGYIIPSHATVPLSAHPYVNLGSPLIRDNMPFMHLNYQTPRNPRLLLANGQRSYRRFGLTEWYYQVVHLFLSMVGQVYVAEKGTDDFENVKAYVSELLPTGTQPYENQYDIYLDFDSIAKKKKITSLRKDSERTGANTHLNTQFIPYGDHVPTKYWLRRPLITLFIWESKKYPENIAKAISDFIVCVTRPYVQASDSWERWECFTALKSAYSKERGNGANSPPPVQGEGNDSPYPRSRTYPTPTEGLVTVTLLNFESPLKEKVQDSAQGRADLISESEDGNRANGGDKNA